MLWSIFETISVIVVLFWMLCFVILIFSDADLMTTFWDKFGAKPEKLAGKVIWVTGASSGIGESIAYQLTRVGCKVILSARRIENLTKVKEVCLAQENCKTEEGDIFILPLDVAKTDSHPKAVKTVLEKFGYIDILLNNAGRGMLAVWWDTEHELNADRDLFDLNVFGTVSLTQHVLKHMLERGSGQIGVVSSLLGRVSLPEYRGYCASKHALQGYFGVLRNELPGKNIDITMILPGPIHSDFEVNQATAANETFGKVEFPDRMSTERCAHLSCVALANRMYESWISKNPPLLATYGFTYMNLFFVWFSKNFSVKMQNTLRVASNK